MKNSILFFILVTSMAHSSQVKIKSITELGSYVDLDTLVIFDLDNTVFQAKTYDCHIDRCYDQFRISPEKVQEIYLRWVESQKSCSVELVELETRLEIEQLQKQNIKVMALTSRGVDLVDDTLKQLHSLGVSFLQTPLSNDPIEFSFNSKAKFIDGILFVSINDSKGKILAAYFDKIKYKPKKIVFIDDLIENLESLETSFPNVEFIGLHYPLVSELKNRLPE